MRAGYPSGGTLTYSFGWYVYGPTTDGYGASEEEDWDFVDCDGEITVVYDWVPDTLPGTSTPDPLDTPPAFVIVRETCKASYGGWYFVPGGWINGLWCGNGLGFAPVLDIQPMYSYDPEDPEGEPTIIGYTVSMISEGTLYTKRAGGPTISLSCTPYASVQIWGGMCSASVSYSSQIIVPKVALDGTTQFSSPDPDAIKFITGQQITATVGGLGPPPFEGFFLQIASYQWSFSGGNIDPFKNYTFGSVGKRWPLEDADKVNSSFRFYSNLGATTKVVCDIMFVPPVDPEEVKFAGGLPAFHAESKDIESVRPTKVKWDVNVGTVKFLPNSTNPAVIEFAGDANSNNGQEWLNVTFNVPGGFEQEGKGCFCQLITAKRYLLRELDPLRPPGNYYSHFQNILYNTEAVDTGFPYTIPPPPPTVPIWDLPALGSSVDSPNQPLSLSMPWTEYWKESTADDSFKTWMMYMPPPKDGQPTTWIPIARYTWNWQGSATKSSQTAPWVQGVFNGVANLPAVLSVTHPDWTVTSPGQILFFGFIP